MEGRRAEACHTKARRHGVDLGPHCRCLANTITRIPSPRHCEEPQATWQSMTRTSPRPQHTRWAAPLVHGLRHSVRNDEWQGGGAGSPASGSRATVTRQARRRGKAERTHSHQRRPGPDPGPRFSSCAASMKAGPRLGGRGDDVSGACRLAGSHAHPLPSPLRGAACDVAIQGPPFPGHNRRDGGEAGGGLSHEGTKARSGFGPALPMLGSILSRPPPPLVIARSRRRRGNP